MVYLFIGKIKEAISTNKILRILIASILVALIILYFKVFFAPGIYFEDIFLKQSIINSEIHYVANRSYGDYNIIVKGLRDNDKSAEVMYNLPNDINRQYTVNFSDPNDWSLGIDNIQDKDGIIIFNGVYNADSKFLTTESTHTLDYRVTLKNIVDLAYSSYVTIRGQYRGLFMALLLFTVTVIDIKHPLFFFNIKHYITVKEPEPSEIYITIQRLSWVVYPTIGIIFMILAII